MHAERYEDMAKYMKELAMKPNLLNEELRNLLSVAFENEVDLRRSALRNISSIEEQYDMNSFGIQLVSGVDRLAES